MAVPVLLSDLGVILVSAALLALVAHFLRQPAILAYVVAGILIGPAGLSLITNYDTITTFAELGIAFLLFLVGMEINLRRLKDVGLTATVAGVGQVVLTFIVGYFIAVMLGFSITHAFYISLALTFSSTMIVVKLLSDKGELETLHARIILGILLIQDVIAIVVLALLTVMPGQQVPPAEIIALSLVKSLGLFSLAIVLNRYVLSFLLNAIARSAEVLFLFAVAWCLVFAFISHLIEFSFAIGAFLAGVSLATFPYNLEIIGRIKSLRDFFATIFFVAMGMQITFGPISHLAIPVVILSLFVFIGNPIIVMFLVSGMGYGKRISFLTGISIAQISEFSLILAAQGLLLRHITQDVVSLIAIVAVVTITASSYFIVYSEALYRFTSPFLKIFERKKAKEEAATIPEKLAGHVVLFGCHRTGQKVLEELLKEKRKVVVVDINSEVVEGLAKQGVRAVYGDVGNTELLPKLALDKTSLVISTVPNKDDNLNLALSLKLRGGGPFVAIASQVDDALELYNAGVDYVVLPQLLSGERISSVIREMQKREVFLPKLKSEHVAKLRRIKEEEILLKYEPPFLRALSKRLRRLLKRRL